MPTETTWTLPTPDGKTIYGVKNAADTPAEAAVFIVHGRTSSMHDYAYKRAADWFSQKGYDVYRFSLYDWMENARTMTDCTLQTHADDVNLVISAYAPAYKHLFAIGHSYGGPSIMLANPASLTAASMWDTTYDIVKMYDDFKGELEELGDYYVFKGGTTTLAGRPMVEMDMTFDEAACISLATNFNAPVQVVFAGDGYYINQPLNYHSHGKSENLPKNRRDVVEGTSHCFHEGDTCEELLTKTHAFFQQFL